MPSELQLRQKRRGERVFIRVPISVRGVAQDGSAVNESGETVVISRFGALLRIPSQLQNSSTVSVTHGFSHETEQFRVVWIGEKQPDGHWDIGVEAANPREDFWGIRFPS